MSQFLFEDSAHAIEQLQEGAGVASLAGGGPETDTPMALVLNELLVHNNRRFFGSANVRADTIVVQGNLLDSETPRNFYSPSTLRFSGIGDGEALPIDDHGITLYYGWPRHFIDLSVIVSRDDDGKKSLSELLVDELGSDDFSEAIRVLALLAGAANPTAAAIIGAIGAAKSLASIALKVLGELNQPTIGLYRGTRLAHPGSFGLGRNPDVGTYRADEMSLSFDVVSAGPAQQAVRRHATDLPTFPR